MSHQHHADELYAYLRQRQHGEEIPPATEEAALGSDLITLAKSLRPDPGFVAALEQQLFQPEASSDPAGTQITVNLPPYRENVRVRMEIELSSEKRRPAWTLVAAVIVLFLVGGIILAIMRQEPEPTIPGAPPDQPTITWTPSSTPFPLATPTPVPAVIVTASPVPFSGTGILVTEQPSTVPPPWMQLTATPVP